MVDFSLLKQNNASSAKTVNALTKQWIISIFSMLSAIFAGFFIAKFFLVSNISNLTFAVIFSIVFLLIFPIKAMLVSNKMISFWCILIQGIGLIIFFSFRQNVYLSLITLALTFALLWRANNNAEIIRENQLRINYREIAKKAISGAILTLAIFVALMYAAPFYNSDQLITENQIRKLAAPIELVLNKTLFKEFSFNMTAREFSDKLTISKLNNQTLAIIEKDSVAKKNFLDLSFLTLVEQGQKWHVDIKPNKTIDSLMAEYINNLIMSSLSSIKSVINLNTKIVIPVIIGFLILITINSSFSMIHIFIYGLSYFLYEILIALGIIHVSFETKNKEVIIL